MKRLAIYSLSFVKSIVVFATILVFLFSTSVFAADLSLVSKTVSGTTATVTVKFENPSIITDANIYLVYGSYEETLGFSTKGLPNPNGTYKESISGLKTGRTYKIFVQFLKNGVAWDDRTGAAGIGTVMAGNTAPTPPAPPQQQGSALPVEFVKSLTELGQNSITVTVKNNSTKTFEVTVYANDASSQSNVEVKKTTLLGSSQAKLFFNQGVTNGNTYDLNMQGKEVGSSTVYQSIIYSGLKLIGATTTSGTTTTTTTTTTGNNTSSSKDKGDGTCNDGKDNSVPLNGKADYYGVDSNKDGRLDLEPDPSCISPQATELSDPSAGKLLSCYNYCTFTDILRTLNNFITFLITTLFVPTVVLVFMFAGFKYLTAQGNPKKVADLKKVLMNIVTGVLLILCSWLIVKVILTILSSNASGVLQFLE